MAVFFSSVLLAFAGTKDKYDVKLYENTTNITQSTADFKSVDAQKWADWKEKHGNWNITIDRQTETPMMAIGKPIAVKGFSSANTDNAEAIAAKFIKENSDLFNVDYNNLELKFVKEVAGKYYVHYVQKYGEYEVINSEVSIRINKNAEVFNFKMTAYNNINVSVKPALKPAEAMRASTKGIELKKNKNGTVLLSKQNYDDKLYILPKKTMGGVDYHLVYKTNFTADGIGKYKSTVDAISGEILERTNQIHNVAANIDATTLVRKRNPLETPEEVPMPGLKIPVNGKDYFTDKEGKVTINIEEPIEISFPLEGKYARTSFTGGAPHSTSTIKMTLNPGENFITLNEDNSNHYERFAIYHINFMHDYMLEIDPSLTCLEDQFTVIFHYDDPYGYGINAYSNGFDIGYLLYDEHSEMDLTQSADVLYHEYGHSVNTNFYQSLGTDMHNGACHEALADLNAALATDFSKIGYGTNLQNPDDIIRDLDNTNRYPDDIEGESHHDSQILSGAFWDIRKEKGVEFVAHLSHFARYGLPDDPDTGVAFGEWLVEVLNVDDDNGDLSDGTPNSEMIIAAFEKHNIGANLLASSLYEYPEFVDSYSGNPNEFAIQVGCRPSALPIEMPDAINFVYTIDDYRTTKTVSLEKANMEDANKYIGLVQFGENPVMIKYYYETTDGTVLSEGSSSMIYDYSFTNGYDLIAHENFEGDSEDFNITNSDNAKHGFEIHKPIAGLSMQGITPFAEVDMTKDGEKCLATGFDVEHMEDVVDMTDVVKYMMHAEGSSEFISDSYELGEYKDVVISFYLHNFYLDGMFGMLGTQSEFLVQYAFNDSENWKLIYQLDPTQLMKQFYMGEGINKKNLDPALGVWRRFYEEIDVPDGAETVKVRVYSNIAADGNGIAMSFDELSILGNPLTKEILTSVEEQSSVFNTTVYPNPATQASKVDFYSEDAVNTNLSLYTIEGQMLNSSSIYTTQGLNTVSISDIYSDFENLSSGTYLLRILNGNKTEMLKLIKK
jgi:hypothetical protein